jgi:hypothetical protein
MSERVDFAELTAKRKANHPDGWWMFKWEKVGDDILLVTGAVCPPKKTGKYKGRPNYKGRDRSTEARIGLTYAEIDATRLAWEAETGKCSECQGSGQEWAGWSKDEGNRFRPCRRCGATGTAPKAGAQ